MLGDDFRTNSRPCLSFLKFTYYFIQLLLLVIGIALSYYSFQLLYTARGSPYLDRLWTSLLQMGIVVGLFMLAYSILGILVVALKRQGLATVYIFLLIGAIFMSIGQIWWVQRQLEEIGWQMSIIWDGLRDESKQSLQALGKCCGFADAGDRPVLPCRPDSPLTGCFPLDAQSPVLERLRYRLLIALSSIFSFGFLLSILCIFILFIHDPANVAYGSSSPDLSIKRMRRGQRDREMGTDGGTPIRSYEAKPSEPAIRSV